MRQSTVGKAAKMRASRWRAPIDALDPAGRAELLTEVEAVLDGRIRDLTLTKRLEALYHSSTWHERAKRIRSWLIWVAILNTPIFAIDVLQNPRIFEVSLLSHFIFLPVIYGSLCWAMTRFRSQKAESLILPVAAVSLMLMSGVLGHTGEGAIPERYLSGGLFVLATGLVIFPVRLVSTISAAVLAIGIYGAFCLRNPAMDPVIRATMSVFYGVILGCLIPARRSMNILHRHSFMLRLEDLLKADRLTEMNTRLAVLAGTDDLTGLANRRAIRGRLVDAWAEAAQRDGSLGVALLDIDHFKRFNDTAGHDAGDRCLIAVAEAIRQAMPAQAVVGRFGGEEFIAVLRDATPESLLVLGEVIRCAVSDLGMPHPGLEGRQVVSVSVGIALATPDDSTNWPDNLVKHADIALYRAKANGRNRVVAAWDAQAAISAPARQMA
ncbi:GGDEF domain-containing protein [Methylobacterium sp. Leaf117]|uniref:GGDEF domain-containing protein n=1 Tax=Methylobacterium sp. Leaf117 TaxID=1736260 RepID=UPI0009E81CDA|nr:GGDEF domain-containing protein [Methylobacterium sp. Leaf117]